MPLWLPPTAGPLTQRYWLSPSSAAGPSDAYGQAVAASGPVAWWRLDNDGVDQEGGNGAIAAGGVTWTSPLTSTGGYGAATFDGSTGYADVQFESQLSVPTGTAFSVECWFNAATLPATSPTLCGTSAWGLQLNSSGHVGGFAPGDVFSSTATVTTGTTHHLAMTCDGTNVLIYLDGNQVGTGTSGATTTTSLFRIGAFSQTTPGFFFNGTLDEVAVYNRQLSASEITTHYTAGAPPGAASASGSITLAGSGSAAASPSATGSITLDGTASGVAAGAATGSITLAGTGTAQAPATATGSITLGGTGSAQAPASASGSISLSGTAVASARPTATGSISLAGTGSAAPNATAAGSITLGGTGTGTPPGNFATGSIALGGTAAASASPAATGAVTLSGAPTGRAAPTAPGSITLTGNTVAAVGASSLGGITLAGAAALSALANATGQITLAGLATGTAGSNQPLDAGPDETLIVRRENRILFIRAENRTLRPVAESRLTRVPAETRVATIPAESRAVLVGS